MSERGGNITDPRLGACGLFCGACVHYRSNVEANPKLYENRRNPEDSLEEFICGGCSSADHEVHPGCRECPTRNCSAGRGYSSCADCSEVPCQELADFNDDGKRHHADAVENLELLRKDGLSEWLEAMEARWTCSCGSGFTWYEAACHSCGEQVDGYER